MALLLAAAAFSERTESFEASPSVPNEQRYCDKAPASCTHRLEEHDGMRTVSGGQDSGRLGFSTYYVNTLSPDGSADLHSCKNGGADIGVVSLTGSAPEGKKVGSAPEGDNVFALRARGIDGFTVVCAREVSVEASTEVRASLSLYVAQAGWHEAEDELRAWADVDGGDRQERECVRDVSQPAHAHSHGARTHARTDTVQPCR